VKKQSPPSSEASSTLSSANGKQIFHITAPAFLPLSKVKEVSLAKVMQGEPVLTHEGVNYGIPPGNISQGDSSEKRVLLYDPKSQAYHSSPMRNIQSFHVQEMIRLPQTTKGGSQPMSASQETAKPLKKQPKHLKMRFRPVGSGDGPAETIGTSSEESEGEKPKYKASKDERKRKHHHTEGDGNQAGGVPRKKSKKHSSQEDAKAPSSSQMDVDEEPGRKKSKKSSKSRDEKKRKKAEQAA
jgi:hypothetical protein